jgi:predicted phage tail protein
MTQVNLHGLLSFEFGESMRIFLRRPKDVFTAIDANKKNFYKRIIELAQIGCHYSIVVDGVDIKDLKELELKKQHKVIDLVPAITGTGGGNGLFGGILTVIGVVAFFFNPGIGIALIGMGVSMMLAPKPGGPVEPPKASVGTASAFNQSFFFSNVANLSQQGSPVPIGYGRLRIGSLVIQSSQSSYPLSFSSNEAKLINSTNSTAISESQYVFVESRG